MYEGVAEVWFDNVADAIGMGEHPNFVTYVKPNEPNFVDLKRLVWMYADEEVLVSGPDPSAEPAQALPDGLHLTRSVTIKLLHFSPASGIDRRTELAGSLGAVRHVRCVPRTDIYGRDPVAFAEVHELWWPTLVAFEKTIDRSPLKELATLSAECVTQLVTAEEFI